MTRAASPRAALQLAVAGKRPINRTGKHTTEESTEQFLVAPGFCGTLPSCAQRIQPQPGVFDVVVHGDANGFYFQNANGSWTEVSSNNVAQYMNANGYAGEPVRLISCNTGSCGATAAQNLANQLGVPVQAPSDTVWIQPNGSLTIGPTANTNTGTWNTFTPGANKP